LESDQNIWLEPCIKNIRIYQTDSIVYSPQKNSFAVQEMEGINRCNVLPDCLVNQAAILID